MLVRTPPRIQQNYVGRNGFAEGVGGEVIGRLEVSFRTGACSSPSDHQRKETREVAGQIRTGR